MIRLISWLSDNNSPWMSPKLVCLPVTFSFSSSLPLSSRRPDIPGRIARNGAAGPGSGLMKQLQELLKK